MIGALLELNQKQLTDETEPRFTKSIGVPFFYYLQGKYLEHFSDTA